jgi:hypothetical protein
LSGFGLVPGTYELTIGFVDETDGNGSLEVHLGDGLPATLDPLDASFIGGFDFDDPRGEQVDPGAATGSYLQPGNFKTLTFGDTVEVTSSSELGLVGSADVGEFARIDFVEFTPIDDGGAVA